MDRSALRLYFICGTDNTKGDTLAVIEEALASGVTMFQLREKGPEALSGKALIDFAADVKRLCTKYDIPFIVNDAPELAEKAGADGIHLGQDDMEPSELPPYFDDKIVGLSAGNEKELEAADLEKVDYIGTGPVFVTGSKEDAGEAIGEAGLETMRHLIGDLPMVAIGGITSENYQSCLNAGADGVSVISAIAGAESVEKAVKDFLQ